MEVTAWAPTLVPEDVQVVPESVDQYKVPEASAPTVTEEFFAATTTEVDEAFALAEGSGTPTPNTPVSTTAAESTAEKASFNHRFILFRVKRNPFKARNTGGVLDLRAFSTHETNQTKKHLKGRHERIPKHVVGNAPIPGVSARNCPPQHRPDPD
jgi:hypothetical protein